MNWDYHDMARLPNDPHHLRKPTNPGRRPRLETDDDSNPRGWRLEHKGQPDPQQQGQRAAWSLVSQNRVDQNYVAPVARV
jgi:hypothetical protein